MIWNCRTATIIQTVNDETRSPSDYTLIFTHIPTKAKTEDVKRLIMGNFPNLI